MSYIDEFIKWLEKPHKREWTERGTPSRSHEQEDRQGLRYCRDTRRSSFEGEKMETAMHVPRERIQLRAHANRHQKHNKANEWNRT